jgi:hypothetical protein
VQNGGRLLVQLHQKCVRNCAPSVVRAAPAKAM